MKNTPERSQIRISCWENIKTITKDLIAIALFSIMKK